MDALLTAVPLSGLQVQRAYSLVGLVHPHVTAKQWVTYARRYTRRSRRSGGLIGIQDGRGYVHGVFCYTVDRSSLDGGRMLQLHHLILAHLPGGTLVAALTTCAEDLAAEFGCTGISVDLPASELRATPDGSTHMKLQGAGFRTSEVKMLRTHVVASASFVAHSRQREFSSNRLIVAGSPFTLE